MKIILICIISVDVTASYTSFGCSQHSRKTHQIKPAMNRQQHRFIHCSIPLSPLMYIDWAVTGDWLEQPCCCVERWLASVNAAVLRRTICSSKTHQLSVAESRFYHTGFNKNAWKNGWRKCCHQFNKKKLSISAISWVGLKKIRFITTTVCTSQITKCWFHRVNQYDKVVGPQSWLL